MAILKAKAQQDTSVARVAEGADVYLRALRDGALVVSDWKQALIMEGRGFVVNVGAFSTPAIGGGTAGAVLDANAPECLVSVPTGTSILPLRISIDIQQGAYVTEGDECEAIIAVDQDGAWDTVGTSTGETIYNLNTLHSNTSACVARSEFNTEPMTTPTLDIELAHIVAEADATGTAWGSSSHFGWTTLQLVYEPVNPPIINGPAMLIVFWGGTVATSAFATITWLELPTGVL